MTCGQIWLRPLVDECQATYLTKWGRGKQKKKRQKKKEEVFLSKKTTGVSHCGLAIYIKKVS